MTSTLVSTLLVCAATLVAAGPRPGRIVGGESTTVERYPWIVQVEALGLISGEWGLNCGANIITSRYVLSAAHCFHGFLYLPLYRRIRSGATYSSIGGIVSNVVREINHPTYGLLGYDGDISVVELETPLVWTTTVQPGTFISQGSTLPNGLPVVHAGWGALWFEGILPDDLQHVTIYTIDNDLCRERYHALDPNMVVTRNMICSGILDVGGRGSCQGDSGGPLYYGNIIVGIVNWAQGCAHETYPGVSANVASYTNWIISTVS